MKLIGRDREIDDIMDHILVWSSGLHIGDGPVGNFLLAGPSGSGKTKTIEYLAHRIHGAPRNFVKIDCGEFQLEHEVAKLIGAPPGYLGHRETTPLITQQKLNAVTSERQNLSLVLFDEIEKAAPSMQRLLLGVLDKGTLRLGDNTMVNFERSVIFFTSNLGTKDLFKKNAYEIAPTKRENVKDSTVDAALRKHFAVEFLNRISKVFIYQALTEEEARQVVRAELEAMGAKWRQIHGSFSCEFDESLVQPIFERGFSKEFGGRELKRTIHRLVTVPLARHIRDEWKGRTLGNLRIQLGWNGALEIEVLEDNFMAAANAGGRKRK